MSDDARSWPLLVWWEYHLLCTLLISCQQNVFKMMLSVYTLTMTEKGRLILMHPQEIISAAAALSSVQQRSTFQLIVLVLIFWFNLTALISFVF